MIPITLTIKNFLSYGPETQTIDFSSYPLICLSGKNGHGKSAMLDAITWALWGQARKIANTAKADHGLLHLGQTNMMVTFDFECNGQCYRIKREYTFSYGKPYALLEFAILQGDSIVPLTDKTIRATQQKIEQTLHLDFDAFINSAFLRQGHSNEFSQKSPKDRKEILASILGLNRYETIRKLALEKTKQSATEKATLFTLAQKYEQDLQEANPLMEQLVVINEQLVQLSNNETAHFETQKKIEEQKVALHNLQKKQEIVEVQISQLLAQKAEWIKKLNETRAQWRLIHKKQCATQGSLNLEEEKKALLTKLTSCQNEIQQLLQAKEQHLLVKEKCGQLEQKIRQDHAQTIQKQEIELLHMRSECTALEKTNSDLNTQLQTLTTTVEKLSNENKKICQTIATNEKQLSQAQAQEKQFEKRKESYHRFITWGNTLKHELEELEQKQLLVHDEQDPSCPLCEQNLSASRKRFLKDKFTERKKELLYKINKLSRLIKKLKEMLIEQHATVEQMRKIKEEQSIALARKCEIETTLSSCTEQIATKTQEQEIIVIALEQGKEKIKNAEKNLNELKKIESFLVLNNEEYKQYSAQLAKTAQSTELLPRAIEQQQLLLKQMEQIEILIAEFATLKEQTFLQEERKATISSLCQQLKVVQKQLQELETTKTTFAHLPEAEKNIAQEQLQLHNAISALRLEKEQLLQAKGRLEAQQKKIQQIEQEYKEQKKKITELDNIISDYQTIAQATSKDGIQALLIEDAIPEIEQEANQLLSKLTDNQAHIYIESLRDLKKGGTKETLDIKISDAKGIRPYELFSGGEAFRIDFALRIAISKLLARRAGTALQTLIIDEGFGSQDEEGLSHIMEAIYKIQEDFAKVIIVSHLPIMKDQFPVHFVIEKGAQGSMVKVVEQG